MLYIKKGGSLREGGPNVLPGSRLADHGKRLDALDVVYHGVLYIKGRESEGGEGKKILLHRTLADFLLRSLNKEISLLSEPWQGK